MGSAIDDDALSSADATAAAQRLTALEQTLVSRDRQVEEMQGRLNEQGRAVDALRAERDEARSARTVAEDRLSALEVRLADAQSDASQSQRSQVDATEKLKQRLDAAATRDAERTRELEIAERRAKEFKDKLDLESRRGQELDATVKRTTDEKEQNERALQSARQEIAALKEMVDELSTKANDAENSAEESAQELRAAKKDYDDLQDAVGTAVELLGRARNKT